jgi:hypothetical protein
MDEKSGHRLTQWRMGSHRKVITIDVPAVMFEGMVAKAKEAGLRPSQYAAMLFEAAYAARVGKIEDRDLDATIGIIMVLSVNCPTVQIARALKISEDLVVRIIAAWREMASERK